MKQKLFYFITLLTVLSLTPNKSSGQGERNNWYFGALAGVEFSGGNPSSLNNNSIIRRIAFGQIEGPDNIAVVSDANGDLLFYTDGRVFKNSQQQNMPSSPTDEYAWRESQQVVTRNPANPDQYYIFVTIQDGLRFRLSSIIIDMSLDNGLGDIILDTAHTILLSNVGQQMTTLQHDNGRDIWLVCQSGASYKSFLVSPFGVSNVPISSQAGLQFQDGNFNNFGAIQAAPNNELIAAVYPEIGKVFVMGFDNLTGELTLIYEEVSPTLQPVALTSVEFSADSNVLYVSHMTEGIRQYNLNNLSQIPNFILVTPQSTGGLSFPHLKRGPFGKIYVSNRGTSFLGAINDPNSIGVACDYQRIVATFSQGTHLLDLPTFLLPERPEGISFLNICLGETTQVRYGDNFGFSTYEWDLGDGSTAMGDTVDHVYGAPGIYTVTVQASDPSGTPTFSDTKEITIYDTPIISPIDNIYNCTENIPVSFIFMESDILGGLDPAIFRVTYYLNEEDALTRDNDIIDYMPSIGTSTIWVRIDNRINFQCFDITSFDIITPEFFTIDIDTEQFICNDSNLTITAPDGFLNYEWNTGSNNQEISVSDAGTYTLTVTKDFGSFTCESFVDIAVSIASLPLIETINITDWSLNSNSIEVIMETPGEYEYSVDNINFQTSNTFIDLPINDYQVFVKDVECGELVNSEELFLLYYDKFFTPNGDGYNDYWQILNSKRETDIKITIYDRYGKLIAIIDSQGLGWDGTYNGAEVPSSDYWYRVERKIGKTHNGHFTLKR